MNLKVLSSSSEKRQGVIGLDKIDEEDVFFFHNVNAHDGFHMRGVKFPIMIAFLDRDFGILQIDRMEPESGESHAPEKTAYAAETHTEYFNKVGMKVGDCWEALHRNVRYNS